MKTQFVTNLKENFLSVDCYSTVPPSSCVDVDETAECFGARSKSTVHYTDTRTVSVRGSGSSNRRLTACVSAACAGTKLPSFVVFGGTPNGRIERQF